jgi:hypothetical protein
VEATRSQRKGCTPIITLRKDGCGPNYIIPNLNRDCNKAKSIEIRSSIRWIDTFKTPNGGLNVPFIDKLGRYTGNTVYKWSCDPRSLITTVTATILKRIVAYARKHNKSWIVNKRLKDLTSAAAYYAISKNSYFWDRILFFCRDLQKRGKTISSLRIFFSSKWDDHKRFVYSQVSFQTNWLLFRAAKPRDKSHFYSSKTSGRASLFTLRNSPSKVDVTNCVREIAYAISMV